MKKIKYLVLVLLVIMCTACGNKETITGEKFYNELSKDYTIEDIMDYYDFADSAYHLTGKTNLDIMFIDTNKANAKYIYIDETKNAYAAASSDLLEYHKDEKDYELKEEDLDKTIVTGDNYSIVEISTNKTYYRIVWIDDTIMIGKINVSKKTTLLNIMKGLGY